MSQRIIISLIATILVVFLSTQDHGPVDSGNMVLILVSIWALAALFKK